jgi:mRNA interferase RelE/StbE
MESDPIVAAAVLASRQAYQQGDYMTIQDYIASQTLTYNVIIPKPVQKELDALQKDLRTRITDRILALAENPSPDGVVKLKGSENEYRIGDYRVRYEIEDDNLIVLVLDCRHRRDIYRKF